MRWIDAGNLEEWARRGTSPAELPGLVGDLIRASCRSMMSFRFPDGGKANSRGFDGRLQATTPALNVPDGTSYWEFGTQHTYKRKASSEIRRVSELVSDEERALSTFVFVTPWTWDSSKSNDKLEDWEARSKEEFGWRDARLLDGLKLQAWLDESPAVSVRHAKTTFHLISEGGVTSTEDFWTSYSHRTSPPLTPEVLLCGREDQKEQLLDTLLGAPNLISFSGDNETEVIAFAIAAIQEARPEVRFFLEARTLVIDSGQAGQMLSFRDNLVYLLYGDAALSPGAYAQSAPTLVASGRHQRGGISQALNRPNGHPFGKALETMGIPEAKAITLARMCGRSLPALIRLQRSGNCRDPVWTSRKRELVDAMLLGAWDSASKADCDLVARLLAKSSYSECEDLLCEFTRIEDAPFERAGSVWKVRAPLEAFLHVAEFVGSNRLETLRGVFITVFGELRAEPDPAEIFKAKPENSRHSEWLREGLATTLLLIAQFEEQARLPISRGEGRQFANTVIESLPGLRGGSRLLASLRDELPSLMEAAPSPFLSALEHMLEGTGDKLRWLLTETNGFLSPVARHTELLWGLEVLAWDPEYFDRSIRILARLASIDPGGQIANRPLKSLREIFLTWSPNTNADWTKRLAGLDSICRHLPDVGWELICKLLPSPYGTSTPTMRPRLREGGTMNRAPLTYGEIWESQSAIISRAVELAGRSPARWREMLPHIANFSPDDQNVCIDALSVAMADMAEDERALVWTVLREEIRRHERFRSAAWAFTEGQLSKLRAILQRYSTDDLESHAVWLFDTWPEDSFHEETQAKELRVQALREILSTRALEGILSLGLKVKYPHLVAQGLSQLELTSDELRVLLVGAVNAQPLSTFQVSLSGLHLRLFGQEETKKLIGEEMQGNQWPAHVTSRLLLSWPEETNTWSFARYLGAEVSKAYWQQLGSVGRFKSKAELLRAQLNFLRYDKPFVALSTAYSNLSDTPTRLLLRILDAIPVETRLGDGDNVSTVAWMLGEVIREIARRGDVSDLEVALREIKFFVAVEDDNRPLKLFDVLASHPEVYHMLLCQVFRAKNAPESDPSALTDAQREQAHFAYSVLSKFNRLPGMSEESIDSLALYTWIDEVRRLAQASDRAEIADIYIGHLIAHAPTDADGAWPHRVVREEIERLKSEELERGVQTERFNMRGVHSRGVFDGGLLERDLAKTYREHATKCSDWPRTSAMLLAIADSWDDLARHHDIEAEKRKLRS